MKYVWRNYYLRNIFLLSMIIAIGLPLTIFLSIFPNFNKLLIVDIENEAVHLSEHMSAMIIANSRDLSHGSISVEMLQKINQVMKEFDLLKLKIYSNSGEALYSSDPQDIGKINKEEYFQNIISEGKPYSQVVFENTPSLEHQKYNADVVEAYVPIINNNRVLGAFEIYYDITDRKAAIDKLVSVSQIMVLILVATLFGSTIIVLNKAGKNIFHREQTEKALAESEKKLNSIIRSVPDVIYRLDKDSRISFIGDSIKQYGYHPEELLGKPILNMVYPEDRPKAAFRVNERRTGERRTEGVDLRFITKNNGESYRVFSISAEGLYGSVKPATDSFLGTQGIARDITELMQVQKELLEREKIQGVLELAGAVCHEMNQPMMAIMGICEIALMNLSEDDPLYDKISKIKDLIDSMGEITKKLMRITSYEVRDIGNKKIIDINKSSSEAILT